MTAWMLQLVVGAASSTTAQPLDLELLELDEVVVRAERAPEGATLEILAEEGRKAAGAQGDILKSLEAAPGVGRRAAGQGELSIWGAAPSDTRAYVDGVLVPRLFHLGGGRSIVTPGRVERVSLTPGGYAPRWGRALGGLIEVRSAPILEDWGGEVAVDPLDVRAQLRAPLSRSVSLAAGARVSILRQTLGPFVDQRARRLVPLPQYYDYHGKLAFKGLKRRFSVFAFGAGDKVIEGEGSSASEDRQLDFHRLAARLEGGAVEDGQYSVLAWVGLDRANQRIASTAGAGEERERTFRAALRAEERLQFGRAFQLNFGLDLEGQAASFFREGALTLFSREGDPVVFGRGTRDRVNADDWSVWMGAAGVFGELSAQLWDVLSLRAGVRLELNALDGKRILPTRGIQVPFGVTRIDLHADPRFTLQWRALPQLTLAAIAGRYHQPPSPRDLSPVFGNPQLKTASAWHALLKLEFLLGARLFMELTGFWIRLQDLAVRAASPAPPQAQALVNEGTGQNFGAQLNARLELIQGLSLSLGYTLMRARRESFERERFFDGDQTHVLSASAIYLLGGNLELGLRFRFATGAPYTPVVDSVLNGRTGLFEPLLGAQNSARLPHFLELSLRVAWSYAVDWVRVKVYLDVQNATNQRNAEAPVYSANFLQSAYLSGLPIVPVLGLEARF